MGDRKRLSAPGWENPPCPTHSCHVSITDLEIRGSTDLRSLQFELNSADLLFVGCCMGDELKSVDLLLVDRCMGDRKCLSAPGWENPPRLTRFRQGSIIDLEICGSADLRFLQSELNSVDLLPVGRCMGDRKRLSASCWENSPRLARSRHGKPPHPPAPAYAPVPPWEKRFVTVVCDIPWERLLEAKKVMPVYKNIIDWDDSGARENFENVNARFWSVNARFWSEFNGLRCDIPPPAPDLYVDNVDYYAKIDHELIADLEKPQRPPSAT